jgi:hypothetical protein
MSMGFSTFSNPSSFVTSSSGTGTGTGTTSSSEWNLGPNLVIASTGVSTRFSSIWSELSLYQISRSSARHYHEVGGRLFVEEPEGSSDLPPPSPQPRIMDLSDLSSALPPSIQHPHHPQFAQHSDREYDYPKPHFAGLPHDLSLPPLPNPTFQSQTTGFRPPYRKKYSSGDVIMWSSCRDGESSGEIEAIGPDGNRDGVSRGAMTHVSSSTSPSDIKVLISNSCRRSLRVCVSPLS